ncbi:MAG: transcriptional regulator [Alphaproteobacteria bacterium]|nr:MAG: transcriptional regulator [Alphaproteobacteria bacterium]
MSDDWIPDLSKRSGSIYETIVDALRRDVHSGRLGTGARLPTHRRLAKSLDVSLGTVTRAYAEARKLGLINGEAGRGMFVAPQSAVAEEGYPSPGESSGYVDLTLNQPTIDYRSNLLAKCLADLAQRHDLMRHLEYNQAPGEERHRQAASAWIEFSGLRVAAEDIILCNGAQQALFASLYVYGEPGGTVVTETLNYPPIRRMAEMTGQRLVGIDVDGEGMIPEALDEALRRTHARTVVCTPRGHNPTTACMSAERRQTILAIADRHGATLIEDDVYGAFYGSGTPTFFELSGGRTIYINSLAKCLAPGLRVGFLVAQPAQISRLMQPIYNTTWCPPGLTGEILVNWIEQGVIKSMLHWHKREIRKRQMIAHWIFKQYDFQMSRGCYHMWLKLPRHLSAEQLVISARQVGLLLTHSTAFSVGDAPAPNALRLALGRPATIRSLKHALQQVADLMTNHANANALVI